MKLSRAAAGTTIGVVAILGVLITLWAARMVSRTRDYRELARHHADEEASERRNIETFDKPTPINVKGIGEVDVDSTLRKNWRAASRLRVDYHAALKLKYERAASHPWLGVAPDPDDPGTELMMPPSARYMTDEVKYIDPQVAAPTDPAVKTAVDRTP